MRYRRAYVASDVTNLVTQLRSESKESGVSVVDPAMSKKDASNGVALVFTGQGAQWKGCGDRLVHRFPVYRRAVEVSSIATTHAHTDIQIQAGGGL
jgi:acyl transferase domain-containing protein